MKSGAMTTVGALQWILAISAVCIASCGEVGTFQQDVWANDFPTHEIFNNLYQSPALCRSDVTDCASRFCYVPPALRYGKYCGIGYTGCDGQAPCDGLDACCQTHDACIGDNLCNYLNVDCNQALIDCLNAFQASGAPQFEGASCSTQDLVPVINAVIDIGVKAGEALNISGKC